jgi:hypothetical protein
MKHRYTILQYCKKLFLVSIALLSLHFTAFAQTGNSTSGINETYAIIDANGTTQFFDLFATTTNPDFQGYNFGSFSCSSTFILKGGQNKVYKCSGGDITSCDIFYRVTKSGQTPGAFSSVNIGFFSEFNNGCGGKDQTWETGTSTTNILAGLNAGSYELEVYSRSASPNPSGGYWYASNNGANYKATFTVTGPSISAFGNQPLCAGQSGTIIFTASSGATVTNNGSLATSPITNLNGGTYVLTATDAGGCTAVTSVGILNIPPAINMNALALNPNCGGDPGSIAYSLSGGTGTLNLDFYGITNPASPITGLTPFTYLLSVTDANGCTASTTVTITEPPLLTINMTTTDAICNGANGTILGGIGGGTGALSLSVNNAPYTTNYPAGTYSVLVTDASSCTTIQEVTITEPPAIQVTGSVSQHVSCFGGSDGVAIISALDGQSPYTGIGTFNSLLANSYTYSVSDANGCTGSTVLAITQPIPLSLTLTASSSALVVGQSLSLTATAGDVSSFVISGPNQTSQNSSSAAYSYNASFSNMALANAGIYTVSAISTNGCTASSTLAVAVSNPNAILLQAKVILGGCYNPTSGLMNDTLRQLGLLPTTEPYSAAPYNTKFVAVNGNVGAMVGASVFAASGPNAIVDWVWVELRSEANSQTIVATKAALVQRDGDIVEASDGVSPLSFMLAPGNYFVSVGHRNHLSIMHSTATAFSSAAAIVDFTNTSTTLFTKSPPLHNPAPLSGASAIIAGKRTLIPGNCSLSGINKSYIHYGTLPISDRQALFIATGGYALSGVSYSIFDVNLNGIVSYNGINSDRVVIQKSCASSAALVVNEQLP